jgi:homoserine acetyltransferase
VHTIVPVVGAAGGDPFLVAWLDVWSQPVRLDLKWRGGNYPEDDPPIDGMTAALKTVALHAQQSDWARSTFGNAPAEEGRDPAKMLSHRFRIEEALRHLLRAAPRLQTPIISSILCEQTNSRRPTRRGSRYRRC